MKLLRVGTAGAERPALLDAEGVVRDLSGVVPDIDGALLADDAALGRIRTAAEAGELPVLDAAGLRVGPPVARIGKIVCIGLNYHDHAKETGAEPPAEPVIFFKAADTVVGPHDTVLVPRGSVKTDWEVELAVVIGRTARYLGSHEEALAHVAGYAVAHDVSEREFQIERGGTWDKGKNCETFNPLGPWLVTADEVPDPQRARAEAVGQRGAAAGRQYVRPDLLRGRSRAVCESVHDSLSRGCHQHRYAGGGCSGDARAQAVPAGGGCRGAGDRGAGAAAAGLQGRVGIHWGARGLCGALLGAGALWLVAPFPAPLKDCAVPRAPKGLRSSPRPWRVVALLVP